MGKRDSKEQLRTCGRDKLQRTSANGSCSYDFRLRFVCWTPELNKVEKRKKYFQSQMSPPPPPLSPSTRCFHKLFSQPNPRQGAVHRTTNSAVVKGAVAEGWMLNGFSHSFLLYYLDHGADRLQRLALFYEALSLCALGGSERLVFIYLSDRMKS